MTAGVHGAYSIQATSLAFPPLGFHSGLALWKHPKEKEMFSLHQDEESTEASSIPVSPGQEASSMVQFAVIPGQTPLPSHERHRGLRGGIGLCVNPGSCTWQLFQPLGRNESSSPSVPIEMEMATFPTPGTAWLGLRTERCKV